MSAKKAESVEARAKQLLQKAKTVAKSSPKWTDLHNAIYGIGGELGRLFPDASDRVAFTKTEEFKEVGELIRSLQADGSTGGPLVGEASGKILLRIPTSMHAALMAEAEAEGVSLNQLCVAKLAAQLRALV